MCDVRHMQCEVCVTPCARVHVHSYAIHASFVRCQQCTRARRLFMETRGVKGRHRRATREKWPTRRSTPAQPRSTLISPIFRRRPNGTASPGAIRKQTTTTGHPQADDHLGPSASRRPPRAIRKQTTTSGHPQTTSSHPQTTSGLMAIDT